MITDPSGTGSKGLPATLVFHDLLDEGERASLTDAASDAGLALDIRESTPTRTLETFAWAYLLTLPIQQFVKGFMSEEGKAASVNLNAFLSQLLRRSRSAGAPLDDSPATILVRDTQSHLSWIISDTSHLDPKVWDALVSQALAAQAGDGAPIDIYVWDAESQQWNPLD